MHGSSPNKAFTLARRAQGNACPNRLTGRQAPLKGKGSADLVRRLRETGTLYKIARTSPPHSRGGNS